jgi:hypothetical protein
MKREACTLMCLCGMSLPAQGIAEIEPNDTRLAANAVTCGAQWHGEFTAPGGDVDVFAVTLASAADLMAATAPGIGAQAGDTYLSLLDAAGNLLQVSDDHPGRGFYSLVERYDLAAGTYYLKVEHFDPLAGTGTYTLDVRCAPPTVLGTPANIFLEAPENNDPRLGGTAAVVTCSARCSGVTFATAGAGDWDAFQVTLAAPAVLRARVDATPFHPYQPRMDDPVLYLLDGGTPAVVLAGPFYGTAPGTCDAAFDLPLGPGTYHAAIRGFSGSTPGSYYLDVFCTSIVQPASLSVNPGGCAGSAGTPTFGVRATNVGPGAPLALERPVFGTTFVLEGQLLPPGTVVFSLTGFQPALFELAPFGAPGCTVNVAPAATLLAGADGAGRVFAALAVPATAALAGTPLSSQLAVLDLTANALGVTTTNSVSSIVGN